MRIDVCVLLALLASTAVTRWATAGTTDITDPCARGSQAELRDCLDQEARESELRLRSAERSAREALGKWDEDERYIAAALKKFDAASRSFTQYRQASCAFEASLGGGAIGSALEVRRLRCIASLNRLQAEHVNNSIASLPLRNSK